MTDPASSSSPSTATANALAAVTAANKPSSVTATTTATCSSSSEKWFESDDAETLDVLLAPPLPSPQQQNVDESADLRKRLDDVYHRLLTDLGSSYNGSSSASNSSDSSSSWWDDLLESVRSRGFRIDEERSANDGAAAAAAASGGKNDDSDLPASFRTDRGKKHLDATSAVLRVDRTTAVRLTLSALRSFEASFNAPTSEDGGEEKKDDDGGGSGSGLRSLLGTLDLLHRTRSYHASRQLDRIRIVSECLRIEQSSSSSASDGDGAAPPSHPYRDVCVSFLDKLDGRVALSCGSIGGGDDATKRKRGLFQLLLTFAAAQPIPPTYDELRTVSGLRDVKRGGDANGTSASSSVWLGGRPSSSSSSSSRMDGGGGADWRTYASSVLYASEPDRVRRIRRESLEALSALLYDRLDGGGLTRGEFAAMFVAFGRCDEFYAGDDDEDDDDDDWNDAGGHAEEGAAKGGYDGEERGGMGRTTTKKALSRLAGLVCGEAVGLWRATAAGGSVGGGWTMDHPLLSGLVFSSDGNDDDAAARQEMDALCAVLMESGAKVLERRRRRMAEHGASLVRFRMQRRRRRRRRQQEQRAGTGMVVEGGQGPYGGHGPEEDVDDDDVDDAEAPESVALLSVGLLLRLGHLSSAGPSSSSSSERWNATGTELAQSANEDGGAFAYLHRVMSSLLPLRSHVGGAGGGGKRWIALDAEEEENEELDPINVASPIVPLLVDGSSGGDIMDEEEEEEIIDAAAVAYASIGREILAATVAAFRQSLLSTPEDPNDPSRRAAEDNAGMLTDLAAVMYRNSVPLCDRFWSDWDDYCVRAAEMEVREGGEASAFTTDPLCHLLDAAHGLAASAIATFRWNGGQRRASDGRPSDDHARLLPALTPLLRLVSAMVCRASTVKGVLSSSFLPSGALRMALLGSAAVFQSGGTAVIVSKPGGMGAVSSASFDCDASVERTRLVRCATDAVESISTLARWAGKDGAALLRAALEGGDRRDDDMDMSMVEDDALGGPTRWRTGQDGPRLLHLIAVQSLLEGGGRRGARVASGTLSILADLAWDCEDPSWLVEATGCFRPTTTAVAGGGFAPFATGGIGDSVTLASMRVLQALASGIGRVAFSDPNPDERAVAAYLEVVGQGSLVACDVLSSFSAAAKTAASVPIAAKDVQQLTALAVLKSIRGTLVPLKPIVALHGTPSIQAVARNVRDAIVSALATSTSLGQAVAYYATAPVSISLRSTIRRYMDHRSVLSGAGDDEEEDGSERKKKYGAWEGVLKRMTASDQQDVAKQCATYAADLVANIHKVPLDADDAVLSGLLSPLQFHTANASLSVLLMWGEHAKGMALERHGWQNLSLDEALVHSSSKKEIMNELRSLSPYRLLLSLIDAPAPLVGSVVPLWPRDGITYLNLVTRYTCVDLTKSHVNEAMPTLKAVRVIDFCIRHTHFSAEAGFNTLPIALGGGLQLHHSVLKPLQSLVERNTESSSGAGSMGRHLFLTTVLLDLLSTCIEMQPQLAQMIFSGGDTKDMRVASLLVRAVRDVTAPMQQHNSSFVSLLNSDSTHLEQARLASSSLTVLSALWSSCRRRNVRSRNDGIHPCDYVVQHLLGGANSRSGAKNDIDFMAKIPFLHPAMRAPREAIHSVREKTCSARNRAITLDIMSKAFDILTIELLMQQHQQATSSQGNEAIKVLMEQAMEECNVQTWSKAFSDNSGIIAAAESWKRVFMAAKQLNLAVNSVDSLLVAFPPYTPAHSWCNVSRAVWFARTLSHDLAAGEAMMAYDAANALATSENKMTSSWIRFAELNSSFSTKREPLQSVIGVRETFSPVATPPPTMRGGLANGTSTESLYAMQLAEHTLDALCSNAELVLMAESEYATPMASSKPTSYRAGQMACGLSQLLMHSLHQSNVLDSQRIIYSRETILAMIGKLYRASNRLFAITHPSLPPPDARVHQGDIDMSALDWARRRAYMVGCLARQRLLSSFYLLNKMVNDLSFSSRSTSMSPLSQQEHKLYIQNLTGFSDLACDTLNLLQYSPTSKSETSITRFSGSNGKGNVNLAYNFDVVLGSIVYKEGGNCDLDLERGAFHLLRVCISVIHSIIPTSTPSSQYYCVYSFGADVAASLQASDAMAALLRHMNIASAVAAHTYQSINDVASSKLMGSTISALLRMHDNAVDVIQRIIRFAQTLAVAGSDSTEMLKLLMENHFASNLFVDNPLLGTACHKWLDPTAGEGVRPLVPLKKDSFGYGHQSRGYIEPVNRHEQRTGLSSSSVFGERKKNYDPVHTVWRDVVQTVASILRSLRLTAKKNAKADHAWADTHRQYLNMIFDFLCAYDGAIFSCFEAMNQRSDPLQETQGNTGKVGEFPTISSKISSSPIKFTHNLLREASASLSLLCEAMTGETRQYFEASCPALYRNSVLQSLEVTRPLSTFLGSIGTARELFAALDKLNSAMDDANDSSGGGPSSAAVSAAFELDPLLSEGIPNARHEAIRNAHYASSCCACMTAEEYALSLLPSDDSEASSAILGTKATPSTPSDGGASSSLEQSFQTHVKNRFITMQEHVAAQCLYFALSIIAKTHPSASSFVLFSVEEALRLDAMAHVQPDMIIALRSSNFATANPFLASVDNGEEEMRYARVIRCNHSLQTWDVEYLDCKQQGGGGPLLERNVPTSRLAGLEDLAKRQCILSYDAVSKSVPDTPLVGPTSVGSLILTLRWCREQASHSFEGRERHAAACTPLDLVKCIAERSSMLLGTEVSLHCELGTKRTVGDELVRKVNAQLLDLFDEEMSILGGDAPSSLVHDGMASVCGNKHGLRQLVDDNVWRAVLMKLARELESARIDRDNVRKNWEQNAGGDLSAGLLGAASVRRGGRRSPFRVFGRMTSFDV